MARCFPVRTLCLGVLIALPCVLLSQQTRPRARDWGIPFGGTPGPLNAITDVKGTPPEVLAVGVGHLYWENDHTLIGQATRVAPVHRSEALFRWDLTTSTGEAVEWNPADSPVAGYTPGTPDEPALQP